ncbi:bifunctional UDP-sugar hydrolase/5'-nucleotidase [Phytohalomonas tamaricis]|uniref:lipoprotein UxpA n=1 Tax=Phytohalomonas tamaricis TaxID=2081032 RepID=UPI000D0B4739|nr:lipoprotein UxpA [Phytohalomonas tamaricis]
MVLPHDRRKTLNPESLHERKASLFSRRRILQGTGAALLMPWFAGCATSGSARRQMSTPDGAAQVNLLYYADTLDTRQPEYPIVPATRLGPSERLGQAPWATAASVAALTGPLDTTMRQLTEPTLATQQRFGGYAGLAAKLGHLRHHLGPQTLTLENGQCWNGSGLSHFTQGRSGVTGSRLLGADVRVSSNERLIWADSVAARYREFAAPVLGTLTPEQNPDGLVMPFTVFERGGVSIAVVGISDPYAHDETRPLDVWYDNGRRQVQQAREQADLVVVLADVGTGPGIWLAERLDDADLILCARGQDFWPETIDVTRRNGSHIPVYLAGTRGSGVYHLDCRFQNGRWQVAAQFHAVCEATRSAEETHEANALQAQLEAERAPYAAWLDRPLAQAPQWLWRRDVVSGSWDALISAALRREVADSHTLSPGLRYDVVVAPGEAITREHLIVLSGGHNAPVFTIDADHESVHALFERACDQSFGYPLLLDNAEDLPRLDAIDWQCRYGAETGRRITLPAGDIPQLVTWSIRPGAPEGEPLWQVVERFLTAQPQDWTLPPRPAGKFTYVEGHPGWHPETRLGS